MGHINLTAAANRETDMPQDIRVMIYESDPFARNWMALLLARDWRTKIVGEGSKPAEVVAFLQQPDPEIDLVLLNAEFASHTP